MDAEQFDALLKDTPIAIVRHRTNTEKGGIGYTDTPTVGGFEPSLPMNYDAMDAADMEAAWIGNVMKHCVNMGSIPTLRLNPFYGQSHHNLDHVHSTWWGRTFWWVNGRCKGLSGGRLEEPEFGFFGRVSAGWGEDIEQIVDHLRTWAPSILRTEGVMPFVEDGLRIRVYTERCFWGEADEWLTVDEAAKRSGRSRRTIRNWVDANTVEHLGTGYGSLIKASSLKFRIDAIKSALTDNAYSTHQKRM